MATDLSKYKKATSTQPIAGKIDLSKYKKPEPNKTLALKTPFIGSLGINPLARTTTNTIQDIAETGSNIANTLKTAGGKFKDIFQAGQQREQTPLETGVQYAGQALGTAFGTAMDLGIGAGKVLLPESLEKKIGQGAKSVLGKAVSTQPVQSAISAYQSASPRTQRNISAGAEILGVLPVGAGAKVAGKAVQRAIPVAGKALDTGIDVAKKSITALKPVKTKVDVSKVIGEIGQVTDDFTKQQLTKALSSIDLKDIKDYKKLTKVSDDKVKLLAETLDDTLETNTNLFKGNDLNITKDIAGQPVTANFVESSLDQLENLYKNIGDPFSAEKIRQLKVKSQTQGLTVKEINDLARDYGNEFNQKAFSKLGEPLTSVTAQGVENTRAGIKETARNLFSDDVFNRVDDELSALIKLRETSKNVSKKVETLRNRIKERTLGEKVGRLLFQATDMLSLGTFGGFTRAILPRGQGFKVMNALDLDRALENNLKQLDSLLNIKDKDVLETELKKIINQSQALPDNQLKTISAANTAKNIDIPTQSNISPKKSTGLINTKK